MTFDFKISRVDIYYKLYAPNRGNRQTINQMIRVYIFVSNIL